MCDTVVVVRDGGVLFAKNSDRDPNEAQVPSWIPAREHAPGSTLACSWIRIPQVPRTHAVMLSRPYWSWGAEMGANEHGLAVGNEAVFARPAPARTGLTGLDLVRLALERAASAAEGVEILRALVATHGQGGRAGYSNPRFRYHNSFLLADRSEAWVLEAIGTHCEAERVRAGVRSLSNALSLPALRGRARGLHERVAGARARAARTACLAAGANTAADLAPVLCDHGEGREAPAWRALNGALSAPCVHAGGLLAASQTTASWISELSPRGDRHWSTASAAPCLSLFRPLAFERPHDTGRPTGSPDTASLWWRHERLHRAVIARGFRLPASFAADRARAQQAIFENPAEGWDIAEDWLQRWERLGQGGLPDDRPWWLRRYWRGVEREAGAAPRMPWRDPLP